MTKDAEAFVAKVAGMTVKQRETWMRKNGFTGLAAAALMRKVRLVWFKEAAAKLQSEMETPEFRTALSREVSR